MPPPTKAQLVLVELAAAAVLGGYAIGAVCYAVGIGVAVVLLPLALVPRRRRWLYQLAASRWGLARRRRVIRSAAAAGAPGLAGLLGDYRVEAVDGGRRGGTLGVVRAGTTWSLPLVLDLDDVVNDDAAVPVDLLVGLLHVEDVPLSSVRLFTLTTPAGRAAHAPAGPAAPMTQLAARYCLLTLDTRRAADAVAARGGTAAATAQVMRRCAVHAEQVLATAGLRVRRLDENAVAALFATWLGPTSGSPGRRGQRTVEAWSDVQVAGTWSTVFAVTGRGPDVVSRATRLAAAAPTPVAATCLLLQPAPRDAVAATMLVRISAPDTAPTRDAYASLALLAQAYDLELQRADGEQAALLRATTPIGVGEPA
ncbi:type VII secretion protein EccE [Jatrophihabitans endophyticus]|uniref:Type VII secretion protein EccE n=1 Tax=Jatrophihabitans endophyticus TaxID=1206085 RepID=A0A1M5LZ66_9ACTN|nr:type VII secretion protein EccE [Jatrophihabitans endophyticus]SHG69693.1 type VII secretion protein EccE [Jatrophihabitans endophyticus]